MRLKPEQINLLTELIVDSLEHNDEIEFAVERGEISVLVRNAITDDLKAEEEIEEEARRLLEEHREQIQWKGMSFDKLLLKTKQKLAQERKMVL